MMQQKHEKLNHRRKLSKLISNLIKHDGFGELERSHALVVQLILKFVNKLVILVDLHGIGANKQTCWQCAAKSNRFKFQN